MSVYKKEVGYNGNERIRFCYSGHGKDACGYSA